MSSRSTSSILLYNPRTKSSTLTSSTRGSFSTRRRVVVRAETMSTTIDKLGIKIERNPAESTLTQLGVRKWPKARSAQTNSRYLARERGADQKQCVVL
ncbi:hypothetical protein ACOSQ4_009076 [Xanthoceras sorbifolium]